MYEKWVKDVCREGSGHAQCSYLVCDGAKRWCAKGNSSLATVIRFRLRPGSVMQLTALGDNCTGPPEYKIIQSYSV